jgi:hypothetical protein
MLGLLKQHVLVFRGYYLHQVVIHIVP